MLDLMAGPVRVGSTMRKAIWSGFWTCWVALPNQSTPTALPLAKWSRILAHGQKRI